MATDLERLVVSLSADIKAYERALAKASQVTVSQLRKMENEATKGANKIEKALGGIGSHIKGFLVGTFVTAAVAGLEELVRGSIKSAAEIGNLADKLGITSDKLQELQYGAVQANMSFEDLESGLLKFSKALGQAQNGSGDLLKILEANGFTKAEIKTLSYGRALNIVADLIKNAKNEQDGLLVSTAGFGKGEADKFLEFLRGGSQALDDYATSAHKAGDVIQENLIKSAQKFDDAWASAVLHVKSMLGGFILGIASDIEGLDKSISGIADRRAAILKQGTRFGSAVQPATSAPQSKNVFSESGSARGLNYTAPKATNVPDEQAEAEKKRLQVLAEQRSKNIQRQIGDLRSLFSAVDKSNVQQEIATQLSRYDVDAKSADGKAIADLVEKTMMHKAGLESVAFAAQQAAEKQEAFADSQIAIAELGVSAFQQWAIEGDKLSDVIANLAKQLAQAAIQASLFGSGPLAGLFGTGASGGFFGNLFKTPGLYAKGGTIKPGEFGITGEKGPELIQGPATVIPFKKMGGSTQNITFAPSIDMRGADAGAVARLTADMRAMSRDFAKNVKNVVKGEKSLQPKFGT